MVDVPAPNLPAQADTESKNQIKISLRYLGTAGGTAATILGAISLITPDQAKDLVQQIHILSESALTMYGALLKMWVILGPAGVIVLGYFGVKSGSIKAMATKLLGIATNEASPQASEAQKAIVQATSTIAQDKTIPASDDAKQTLIAATIALPEVQTIVTDKKTAEAAPSESVVAAEAVKVIPK
jgi:uncharacterized protein YjeT (DUF2065 family)